MMISSSSFSFSIREKTGLKNVLTAWLSVVEDFTRNAAASVGKRRISESTPCS